MEYCKKCGEIIEEDAVICPHCGKENLTEEEKRKATEFATKKDPFIAAILSVLIPGLGQVYSGSFKRGITIQIFYIISLFIGFVLFFLMFIPIIIILAGVYDAYTGADKVRKGEKPDKNATIREVFIFLLWPFVLIGVLLTIALIFSIIAMILIRLGIISPFLF